MITCWLCQRIVSSRIDASIGLPDWTRNHLHNCAACREVYESATMLAQKLFASADAQRRSPSPFLHGKIMAAVRSQENGELQSTRGRLGWAMAVSAACLLAVGILWLRQPSAPYQEASGATLTPPDLSFDVSLPTVAQVNQWTTNLDAPLDLERETKLVLLDAKTALATLASNFLPEDLLASSAENARP